MTSILVIPDAHAHPDHDNERFTKLGNLIVSKQPEHIVCLGDLFDMPSLCSYDIGKKSFEGRRYALDIQAGVDAQEKLFQPLNAYNKGKKRKYQPELHFTLGNHENRINRAINDDAKLDGTISIEDLQLEEFGWTVYKFKQYCNIHGINFSHYYPSGNFDKAISAVNAGKAIIAKTHSSAFCGHSHLLNIHTEVDATGKRLWAGPLGCYFEHIEDYVSETVQKSWWRGVTLLHNVEAGELDIEHISMSTVLRDY